MKVNCTQSINLFILLSVSPYSLFLTYLPGVFNKHTQQNTAVNTRLVAKTLNLGGLLIDFQSIKYLLSSHTFCCHLFHSSCYTLLSHHSLKQFHHLC